MVLVMEALSSTGADAATAPAPIDKRNTHTTPVQRVICHSPSERWTSEPEGIPSVVAESRPQEYLGRSPGSEVQSVLCGRFTFPGTFFNGPSGYRSGVLTHSGGTAPDSHRTSLLCPPWAPRRDSRYITTSSRPTNQQRFTSLDARGYEVCRFAHQRSRRALARGCSRVGEPRQLVSVVRRLPDRG